MLPCTSTPSSNPRKASAKSSSCHCAAALLQMPLLSCAARALLTYDMRPEERRGTEATTLEAGPGYHHSTPCWLHSEHQNRFRYWRACEGSNALTARQWQKKIYCVFQHHNAQGAQHFVPVVHIMGFFMTFRRCCGCRQSVQDLHAGLAARSRAPAVRHDLPCQVFTGADKRKQYHRQSPLSL